MPLLRLWNSIRGRSAAQEPAKALIAKTATEPVASTAKRPSRGPRLNLFGGGQPHEGLRKLVKPLAARSVLEISVGDGSRAIAMIETLAGAEQVRYIAIDQFEMTGGAVTLKAFHQTMRAANIRPQVFPESIDRGLVRVANTVGMVDLIVIATEPNCWQIPEILSPLRRVSHPQTIVLYQDDQNWKRYDWESSEYQRRAA